VKPALTRSHPPLDPALVELAKALARRLAREDYARMTRPESGKVDVKNSEG
jgi:hypothetical protein